MTRLVIAEKPSVARDLARVLGARTRKEGWFEGEDLRISWCIGHLAELEDPVFYNGAWKRWSFDTLPMIPEKFSLKLRSGVLDHWKVLRNLLRDRQLREVINACDAGREGELIFRYVLELAGVNPPVRRLWVSSLTDEAILEGWGRLRQGKDFDALADAARCRSEADWLVGLNATRALTCLARTNGGEQLLSVGRVQTPTLAMIVARDREIAAFRPETYWLVKAKFQVDAMTWEGSWFQGPIETKQMKNRSEEDEETATAERLPTEELARAVANAATGQIGVVSEAERKRTREAPPLLYDLTSLQRRANERYAFSADKTLTIAQALYEKHKLITYPRTDARFLTPDQVGELPKIVQGLSKLEVYQPFAMAILAKPIQPGKRVIDPSEVGDHHAILPTGRTPDPSRLEPDERRIYDLIARRLLAVLSPDAVFDHAVLIVDVPAKYPLPNSIAVPLRFRARGRICRDEGWRAVDPPGKTRDVELPAVEQGDTATVVHAEAKEGQTRPPRSYSDSTLLRGMETAGRDLEDAELKRAMRHGGLGTPATRAEILKTLIERKYIERKGRELKALPRGIALIDAVPVAELKNAELTGRWEARLAAMAENKESRAKFMSDVAENLQGLIQAIREAAPPPAEVMAKPPTPILGNCPLCDKPVREGRAAFSCETGRECAFVIFKMIARRKIGPKLVRQLLSAGRTEKVAGFKSKAGKSFDAVLIIKEGKVGFEFPDSRADPSEQPMAVEKPILPMAIEKPKPVQKAPKARKKQKLPATPVGMSCPQCGQGEMVAGRAAWGCNRWREGCRFILPFEREGHRLTEAEAVEQVLQSSSAR